jgi:Flp pilus assembly protein TadG
VEFALVAFPFLALLMAIVELGMICLVSTELEDATVYAARQIRLGTLQSQSNPETATQFRTTICNQLAWLGSQCAGRLEVSVNTYSQFSSETMSSPISNGSLPSQANLTFNLGGPGDIVLVRTYYPWPLIAPLFDGMTAQTSNGSTLLTAAATFRNEPYATTQ